MIQVHAVGAARGWRWVTEGFALFQKNPLMWVAITGGLFIAFKLILLIPLIGIAAVLLMPILLVGLMEGCRALDMGQELKPAYLLSGFTRNTGALATLGAVYLMGNLLILLAITMLGGESLMQVLKLYAQNKATPENVETLRESLSTAAFAVTIGWLLSIPLLMACWFSPLLIYLHDMRVFQALLVSLKACLLNTMPFLIYGGVVFVALFLTTPISLATGVIDLGMWLLAPLLIPSLYASYKDIFPAPNGPGESTTPA
jgi:hypothetical protein